MFAHQIVSHTGPEGLQWVEVPEPGGDGVVIRSAPAGTGLAARQRVAVLLAYGCWQEVISVPLPGFCRCRTT